MDYRDSLCIPSRSGSAKIARGLVEAVSTRFSKRDRTTII